MKKNPACYFILSGLITPILFTSVTLICSGLRSGYNHVNQFISELAATGTPNADLMNYAGFIPSGILLIVYGICLWLFLPRSLLGRIGAVLISVFGIGVVVAGLYSCDAGCPPNDGSFDNVVHNGVSGPAFFSAIIGIFLLGLSFRRSASWKKLWLYSVISAIASAVFIILLLIYLESPVLRGLWQRFVLLIIFVWLGVTATRLFKLSRNFSR
jgi:hypothetical membrane protein